MWDNPRLLNAAANVLIALALALAVFGGVRMLVESPAFLLRSIVVGGALNHVQRGQIVEALRGRLRGTLLTADIDEIRSMFEGIPWVRRAEVRRAWPDRLEVQLEEHVALARWEEPGAGRLVNIYGEPFAGDTAAELPLFSGPAGSEREISARYAKFRNLLGPLALEPRQILLSLRHAWQLKLSNGLTVKLGRDSDKDPLEERLVRFVAVYPRTLGRMQRRLDYVDLRYPNGFALRVPELDRQETKGRRGRA